MVQEPLREGHCDRGCDNHRRAADATPAGHFVVMAGYDRGSRTVLVADPYGPHPYAPSHEYWISIDRVLGAVLLGIVTHDANLLVIHPPRIEEPETQ